LQHPRPTPYRYDSTAILSMKILHGLTENAVNSLIWKAHSFILN